MAKYVMPGGLYNFLLNLEQIVRIVMSWSTVTLEVFIRKDFGERYLSFGRIILGLLTIRFFLMLANLQTSLSWLPGVRPLASERAINQWFVACYLLLSLIHLVRIQQRNRAGVAWHSRSFGISSLSFLTTLPTLPLFGFRIRITDWMLYRFIEPFLCLLVVLCLMPEPSFTRNWFIWSSIAMLVHNNMVYNARRDRFLDLVDSHIEGGYYDELSSDVRNPAATYQATGYVAMPVPPLRLPELDEAVDMQTTLAETMGMTGTQANRFDSNV